uniref:Uncharacterized protein n=1 Tax=Arundo donax TaxID=35708 RepID=A0A0A9HUX4_ARUDO
MEDRHCRDGGGERVEQMRATALRHRRMVMGKGEPICAAADAVTGRHHNRFITICYLVLLHDTSAREEDGDAG